MLDMVCAPMPFLVGVMTPHMAQVSSGCNTRQLQSAVWVQVASMPLEEVVIVDLDTGKLKKSPGCLTSRCPALAEYSGVAVVFWRRSLAVPSCS